MHQPDNIPSMPDFEKGQHTHIGDAWTLIDVGDHQYTALCTDGLSFALLTEADLEAMLDEMREHSTD